MYSRAKGAEMTLDCAGWNELAAGRTEVEKDTSGKGLLDGDGCGLLLGLVVECQYALDWSARRHNSKYLDLGLALLGWCCRSVSIEYLST